MEPIDRRHFIGTATGATALAGTATMAGASEPPELPSPPRPPLVDIGQTGIRMSRVGQGTGVHGSKRQSDQTRLGFAELVALFRHAYDRGITFFDLADLYGTHLYFREALRSIPRDEVTILTKVWWRFDGPEDRTHLAHRRQTAKSTLERFRHELTTDYLDVVLLHCLRRSDWNELMKPYLDLLSEEKQQGRVKAVGVSCHDLTALKTAATEPWVDVILARVNPQGVKMDGAVDEVVSVLRQAKQNGKAILGMKILGEGQLADQREACVKFAQGLGLLDAMTIGFHTPAQVDDMLQLIAKFPAAAPTT